MTQPEPPLASPPSKRRRWLFVTIIILAGLLIVLGVLGRGNNAQAPSTGIYDQTNPRSSKLPELIAATIIEGLDHPWDVAFLPDQTVLFTERSGGLSKIGGNGQRTSLYKPDDLVSVGEGGMMGLAVDPNYGDNRQIYICMLSRPGGGVSDVRVVRLKLNSNATEVTDRRDIVTGLPVNDRGQFGRHSGCRPRFGPDGNLWIGTGDAALAAAPQSPSNLGGKILRVDRDGRGVAGNQSAPFDNRIYSYGHRNVQGIAFWPSGGNAGNNYGVSLEHGPDRDDELNVLEPGNFGWDPDPAPYTESVDMTDLSKFPDAVKAIWKTGAPTIAPGGATFLTGRQWQGYEDALFAAILKGEHVHVFFFDENRKLLSDLAVLSEFGRLRSAVQGPDGALYLTTDNGSSQDKIIRVVPGE